MRFLIDAQLPPRLALELTALGHVAEHVWRLGLAGTTDRHIWEQAVTRGAILVTKDQDFPALRTKMGAGPVIVWVRLGNVDNGTLIRSVIQAIPAISAAIERGDTVIELISR